jgi:hypothetical protein
VNRATGELKKVAREALLGTFKEMVEKEEEAAVEAAVENAAAE